MKILLYILLFFMMVSGISACEEGNETHIGQSNGTIEGLGYCNITLMVYAEKNEYNNSERVKFFNELSNESYDFEIEYGIYGVFGEVIRKPKITKNTDAKYYTPKIDEKERIFVIKSRLVNISCNNTAQNLTSEFAFLVTYSGFNETNKTSRQRPKGYLVNITAITQNKEVIPEIESEEKVINTQPERIINGTEIPPTEDELVYSSSGEKAKSKSFYLLGVVIVCLALAWFMKYGIINKSNHRSSRFSSVSRR